MKYIVLAQTFRYSAIFFDKSMYTYRCIEHICPFSAENSTVGTIRAFCLTIFLSLYFYLCLYLLFCISLFLCHLYTFQVPNWLSNRFFWRCCCFVVVDGLRTNGIRGVFTTPYPLYIYVCTGIWHLANWVFVVHYTIYIIYRVRW